MLAVKYRVSNGAGTVLALNTRNPSQRREGGCWACNEPEQVPGAHRAARGDAEEQCGSQVAFPAGGLSS